MWREPGGPAESNGLLHWEKALELNDDPDAVEGLLGLLDRIGPVATG